MPSFKWVNDVISCVMVDFSWVFKSEKAGEILITKEMKPLNRLIYLKIKFKYFFHFCTSKTHYNYYLNL
jgi:hypothetical protein